MEGCDFQLVTHGFLSVSMKRNGKYVRQHRFCRNATELAGFLRHVVLQEVVTYVYVLFLLFVGA